MITYKITTMFQAEWPSLFKAVFGADAVCVASLVDGNVATYSFATPQTPADLGPLVKVELLSQ